MVSTKEIAKRLGKRGGKATKSKHGSKHFAEAGKKGMAKRWGNHRKKGEASFPL
jgi:general stress protein YciG